jgi:hypothetical protein
MTPRQDSLPGVIICPAYWKGQRFKVNSFTYGQHSFLGHWGGFVNGRGMGVIMAAYNDA